MFQEKNSFSKACVGSHIDPTKSTLSMAIMLALSGTTGNAGADLSPGTSLNFDPGTVVVTGCLVGALDPNAGLCTVGGTPVPGIEITDIGGSYFAMDTDGNPEISPFEKIPLSQFSPIIIGSVQQSFGQHTGLVDGTESQAIDNPWNFFNNTGMHTLTSPVALVSDSGVTKTLDFSGWGVNWGEFGPGGLSGPTIPLSGTATIACAPADCPEGGNYRLDMDVHVPGAFESVPYSLHLEGTIGMPGPIPPALDIVIPDGVTQECDEFEGTAVAMSASVSNLVPGDSGTVSWFLDGDPAAQGEAVEIMVPLGTHTIEARIVTTQSGTVIDFATVTIEDTVNPQIEAGFVDPRTGIPISEVSRKGDIQTVIEVTDLCDLDPAYSATFGTPARNGDTLNVKVKEQEASLRITSDSLQNKVELNVLAEDASGNASSSRSVLTFSR